jgi:hypothetical protein
MIRSFPSPWSYLKVSFRRPLIRGVVGRGISNRSVVHVPWRGVLALLICAIGRAHAQAPQPDPEMAVTYEMRDQFESACEHGVQSVDARHRPPPLSAEYAYIECVPFNDEKGREIGRVAHCERPSNQSAWSCREHLTNVGAVLKGQPIVFSYTYSTVEQSLEVLGFVLASPQLGTLVPAQWASSKLYVHHSPGRFLVDGNVGEERYSFQLRESRGNESPFEVLTIIQCQSDTCHPIWPRE